MVFRSAHVTVVLALASGAACSGGGDHQPDAFVDHGPCWPVDESTSGGSIALGTGMPFVALPDEVPLEYYLRGDLFYVSLNARVTSIMPGNIDDSLDPGNPRTRFRGFDADTGEMVTPLPISCPIRIGYTASAEPGTFELSARAGVAFPSGLPESMVFGRRVRIEVEVIDAMGTYARDEKIITCRPPTNWPTMAARRRDEIADRARSRH